MGPCSVFDGPARAIRCAEALRDALAAADVPIRAGIHTGECEVMGEDIGGVAIHIGARVAALAGPGEILVSSTVADLLVGSGAGLCGISERAFRDIRAGRSNPRPALRAALVELAGTWAAEQLGDHRFASLDACAALIGSMRPELGPPADF